MAHTDDWSNSKLGTKLIHAGQEPDPVTGAVTTPISLATTYVQASPGVASGKGHSGSYFKGYEYSRTGNPTRAAFEMAVAAAESGKHGVAFASGLAATGAILNTLQTGDHVISIDDVYGGTQRYFRRIVTPGMGITFDFLDLTDTSALESALEANPRTKLVWLESPTNPTLKVADIEAVVTIAHRHGALVCMDNTFMSPYFQRPLEMGADYCLNSVTKYINGHSDVVMGIVTTTSDELADGLRFVQNSMGAVPDPHGCYLALRGLKTLHVRMQRHGENALRVAEYLEAHDMVDRVIYPGLPSHPQYEVAKKQSSGGGGMVTFYIKGGLEGARKFLETVRVFILAESLGAVESLAESPAIMTHASVPPEKRAELNISDSLVRLSVGIEDIEDILEDIRNALEAARTVA